MSRRVTRRSRVGEAVRRILLIIAAVAGFEANAASIRTELLKCAEIEARLDRLECFETLADIVANSEIITIPVEDLAKPREPTPDSEFGNERRIDQITARITNIQKLPRGQHELTLDNQQVWQEIEASTRSRYAVGDTITIERTPLGAYRLKAERNGFTNKVTRSE